MNTLALVTLLVNQTVAWSEPDAGVRFLDLVSHVHGLIGSLIVVIAVLIVANAERQWRSRITSAIVALVMVGIVVVGCAPVAGAVP
jgi:uncharacterized membrane protein